MHLNFFGSSPQRIRLGCNGWVGLPPWTDSRRSKRARAREGDLQDGSFVFIVFVFITLRDWYRADRSKRMEREGDRSTIDGIYWATKTNLRQQCQHGPDHQGTLHFLHVFFLSTLGTCNSINLARAGLQSRGSRRPVFALHINFCIYLLFPFSRRIIAYITLYLPVFLFASYFLLQHIRLFLPYLAFYISPLTRTDRTSTFFPIHFDQFSYPLF